MAYVLSENLDFESSEFDRLCKSSLPYLDDALVKYWPSDCDTEDKKVEHVRGIFQSRRDADYEDDQCFMGFKIEKDGYLVGYRCGYKGSDGFVMYDASIYSNDANGSRAWPWSAEYGVECIKFAKNRGCIGTRYVFVDNGSTTGARNLEIIKANPALEFSLETKYTANGVDWAVYKGVFI